MDTVYRQAEISTLTLYIQEILNPIITKPLNPTYTIHKPEETRAAVFNQKFR